MVDASSATRTIYIDDSGWGFPLGGVLCGAYDTETKQFVYREVDVQFFRERFHDKTYLREFGLRARDIVVDTLRADPKTTKIIMCRGYILDQAYHSLSRLGYSITRAQIKEPLQSNLENYHASYVHKLGYGSYYDPKDIAKEKIPREFYKAIEWAVVNGREEILKTGWKFFREKRFVLEKFRRERGNKPKRRRKKGQWHEEDRYR